MIVLHKHSKQPLYAQLYDALREQIISGQLAAGVQLSSRRTMAQELGISVNTVDAAYGQLCSEGYVQAKARSGFVVCQVDTVQRLAQKPAALTPMETEVSPCAVDFSPGGIAVEQFPLSVWQKLTREVYSESSWLLRRNSQGDLGLRQAIADYLAQARNVQCTVEQIVLGSGTESLIMLLGLLIDRTIPFAVENPVYNQSHRLLAQIGHLVVAADVDKQGIMMQALEKLSSAVVYTTPSHQYPLGICMPMARRVQLLNWCAEREFRYLLEDDYDSEFRYDARPVPPLYSLDRNERVIYLGTFSGTVSPSLRIGYMVLPPSLLQKYRQAPPLSCQIPTAEQLILQRYLQEGHYIRHLNRMRTYYKKQRKLLLQELAEKLPKVQIIGEAAGHHLTLRVPGRRSAQWLCQRAEEQGVKVYPIDRYFLGNMPDLYRGKVLLGFGALSHAQIIEGISRLQVAWQDA